MLVAEASPSTGVVKEGEVAKTSAPEPVSLEIADAKFALVGLARNVATFVPRPVIPVEIGNPEALVNVRVLGVPKLGVVSEGDVDKTTFPVPVDVVTPVPPLATGKVPETPVVRGSAVALTRDGLDVALPSAIKN
jgi:hypothetical protein